MPEMQQPYVQQSDKLFKADADWWHNACLNYLHDDHELYADGYKCAADMLVERASEHREFLDGLVYPIVFLYRQYIELRIKILLRDCREVLGAAGPEPITHDLQALWATCSGQMRQVWQELPLSACDAVKGLIAEFSAVDPASTAFRYPTDTKGNRSLPGLTHLNVRNLFEVMQRLDGFLKTCSSYIDYYVCQVREMHRAYW